MRNAGGLLKESPAPPGTFPEYDCDCPESARMRGSGLFSVFFCGVTWWLGVVPVTKGGLPSLSPACPAFCFDFAPYPPDPPSPAGKGEILGYFMQGASPLASPAAEPARRLLALPLWYPAGGVPPALPARRALAVPCGGLPSLSPAYPAFSLLSFPHPPDPLPPRGRGRP